MPKNNKSIAANAAAPTITPAMSNFTVRATTYPGGSGTGGFDYGIDISTLPGTSPGVHGVNYTTGGSSITVAEDSLYLDGKLYAITFKIELNVPARTAWDVEYTFSQSVIRGSATPAATGGVPAETFFYIADDEDNVAQYIEPWTTTPEMAVDTSGTTHGAATTDTSTVSVLYKNESATAKNVSRSFAYVAVIHAAKSNHHKLDASLTLDGGAVTGEYAYAPTATTTSGTYTGSALSFAMNYNTSYVVPTAVTGTDPTGGALAKAITLADIDTTTATFKPTLAGTYTVTFDILPTAAADGITWVSGTPATPTLTFTVNRKPIPIPANTPETFIYSGSAQSISYTHANLSSLTVTPRDTGITFTQTASSKTDGTFSVTDAGDYLIDFDLNDVNLQWDAADALGTKTITVKMKPKTLEFDFKFNGSTAFTGITTSSTGNITAAYKSTGTPVGSEVPKLNFSYEFGGVKKPIATDEIANLTKDITTLQDSSLKFGAGSYKLIMELTSSDAVNANYTLGASKEMTFTVGAGAATLSSITTSYTTNDGAEVAIPAGGLVYKYDPDTKTADKYKFYLDFSAIDYLAADSYTYKYSGESSTVTEFSKAGTAEVTAKIKLADPTDIDHSLPATFAVAGTPFDSYTNNSDGTATLVYKVVIDKATASINGADIPLVYQFAGDTPANYDPKNPPQCKDGIPVTITLGSSTLFPHGVQSVAFDDSTITESTAGNYVIDATVTLTDDYKSASGGNTVRVQIPWTLAKQIIKLSWKDEQISKTGLTPHFVKVLNNLSDDQKGVIKYVYYKDVSGAPDTTALTEAEFDALCTNDRYTDPKWLWVEAVLDTSVTGWERFELENNPVLNPVRFKLGRNMTLINVSTSGLDKLSYGDGLDKGSAFTFTDSKTGGVWNTMFYELHVYKDGVDLGLFDGFDFTTADAGKDYTVEVIMTAAAKNGDGDEIYALDTGKSLPFEIQPKKIALPELTQGTFNGSVLLVADMFGGESWTAYGPAGLNILKIIGDSEVRNVSASNYVTTLEITNGNYCWDYGTGVTATAYTLAKISLADVSVSGTAQQAEFKWNLLPLVLDATNLWNKGKNGATLNLPQNILDLIGAGTLEVGYRYYDGAGNYVETPELKSGKQFKVEAVFGGEDAERNVQFMTGETTFGKTSPAVNYTVPQSGASAFFGNALSFVKSNWLWFVIALAALIFLIILICIIRHRKKTKEERLAKKEAEREKKEEEKRRKEEEKQRKEEERIRKEEEREAAKQKQQAELELQKAKQEAELAKIKAQAGMAGAGVAAMAMAQPQPQQMPQPQYNQAPPAQAQPPMPQQPYPQMQPQYDRSELAELRADIAELKAQQRINNNYPQMPMMQMPMQMPVPQYNNNGGGGSGGNEVLITMLQNQLNEMRNGNSDREIATLKTQLEIMKLKAEQGATPQAQALPQYTQTANANNSEIEKFGAFAASLWRNMNSARVPKEIPQSVEESKPVSVSYPPDAVVTTTTTVDTTKNSAPVRSREDDLRALDIDGFYDTFEEK